MDLTESIKPKSDQLNADDLIAGSKTIKIRDVKGNSDQAQPISIYFDNDDNKPYKPCKSMRRLMVAIWGTNGNDYLGRSITLFRDNKVSFGGIDVGGIRISHASHIASDVTISLTASKTKRIPYTVKMLKVVEKEQGFDINEAIREMNEVTDIDKLKLCWSKYKVFQSNELFVKAKDERKLQLTPAS